MQGIGRGTKNILAFNGLPYVLTLTFHHWIKWKLENMESNDEPTCPKMIRNTRRIIMKRKKMFFPCLIQDNYKRHTEWDMILNCIQPRRGFPLPTTQQHHKPSQILLPYSELWSDNSFRSTRISTFNIYFFSQ